MKKHLEFPMAQSSDTAAETDTTAKGLFEQNFPEGRLKKDRETALNSLSEIFGKLEIGVN